MPEEQHISDEQRARLTREFLTSDFYKLVFKPELDRSRLIAAQMTSDFCKVGNRDMVFGWQWYINAIDDIEKSWVGVWKDEDKMPDLSPPDYSGPRYPKVEGEE